MNEITKKFANLSAEQSKALSKQMNSAYNKGGGKAGSGKKTSKPPTKKK